jgi:hypothetical protein
MMMKAPSVHCLLVAAALVVAGCTKSENKKQESEDRKQESEVSSQLVESVKQEVAAPTFQEPATPLALPPGHPDISMSTQTLPAAATTADVPNPEWTVPAGWQEGQASAMRRATFVVKGDDGQTAEVAVSTFPGDVGGLPANVNRWRGQIGLGPLAPDQVGAITADVDIDGVKVTIVEFQTDAAPAGKTHPQGMIVAILTHEGNSWFFKMTGDAPLVTSQHEELLQFVKSVKF